MKIDKKVYRPAEVDVLLGDFSKARYSLGWKPKTNFKELAKMIVNYDLNALSERGLNSNKWFSHKLKNKKF